MWNIYDVFKHLESRCNTGMGWVAYTFIYRHSSHLAPDRGGAEGHSKSLQEPLEQGLAVIGRRPIHSPGYRTLVNLPYLDTSGSTASYCLNLN